MFWIWKNIIKDGVAEMQLTGIEMNDDLNAEIKQISLPNGHRVFPLFFQAQ